MLIKSYWCLKRIVYLKQNYNLLKNSIIRKPDMLMNMNNNIVWIIIKNKFKKIINKKAYIKNLMNSEKYYKKALRIITGMMIFNKHN